MTIEEVIDTLNDIETDAIYSLLNIEIQAIDEAIEILEKVRDGKMIELPCKIGTKIYDISELLLPQCYSPEMYIFDADDICISKDNQGFIFTIDGNDYRYEDFGKSAFFSKEEAFIKLKECENNA